MESLRGHRKIFHLDADLYSSILFVLMGLCSHLERGAVILFDDFNCAWHEFRAFHDFARASRLPYTVLGSAQCWRKVAIKVKT